MDIAPFGGGENGGREGGVVARQGVAPPAGEIGTAALEAVEQLEQQRRVFDQAVHGEDGQAQGMAAELGRRAIVAQGKAPAADGVPRAADQRERRRSRAGNDNAAVGIAVGAETGGIGVAVHGYAAEGQVHRPNTIDGVERHDPGEAEAGMELVQPAEPGDPRRFPGSRHDRGHGGAEVLIDVGEVALGGSQAATGGIADARPAPRAAAVDAKEVDFGHLRAPVAWIIPR